MVGDSENAEVFFTLSVTFDKFITRCYEIVINMSGALINIKYELKDKTLLCQTWNYVHWLSYATNHINFGQNTEENLFFMNIHEVS